MIFRRNNENKRIESLEKKVSQIEYEIRLQTDVIQRIERKIPIVARTELMRLIDEEAISCAATINEKEIMVRVVADEKRELARKRSRLVQALAEADAALAASKERKRR